MNNQKNHFTLTTAPRKNFLLMGVLTLWLALWGGGLVVVASALLRGELKEVGFFVIFFLFAWLAGWSLGGGLALYGLLWMGFGSEAVVVTPGELMLTRTILGNCRVHCYDAGKIRSLRLAERGGATDFLFSFRPFGIGNGLLTFDYGGKVVTFAEGIDRAAATGLLAELRAALSASQDTTSV